MYQLSTKKHKHYCKIKVCTYSLCIVKNIEEKLFLDYLINN